MKKRFLAVLMAAVMGTCAVPAYADTPETAAVSASQADTAGDAEETLDEEVLTTAETVMDNEPEDEDAAPSVDAEISVDEDAPSVVEDATEAICRVYHEKRWAGRSTSWNKECREKYQ